jgi:transposase
MLLLSQGYRQSNYWWQGSRWEGLKVRLPAWLLDQLETYQRVIECVDQQVRELRTRIVKQAPKALPKGMGALTHEVLEREMKDWNYFTNRRQVGSYSGLTGGVSGSGEQSADLSITKAGNRRVSCCLIECAWRMVRQQPDYWLVKKWRGVLANPKVHVRRRKQVIVAFARQLLVDVWKWKTGRATPEGLGWKMI